MKMKLLGITAVTFLALTACQAPGNVRDNAAPTNPNNVEQTRFYNNAGEGMTNVRNYTMDRNSEQFQNRDNTGMWNRGNVGLNNRDNNRFGTNVNNNNQYDISQEAAERITDEVDGIRHAYVLTTNNNAYVAATLNSEGDNDRDHNRTNRGNRDAGDELTDDVKDEIGDIVKSVDNRIDNVYVSTNPDFINLTNNYANDLDEGRPVEGFFQQMGNMIERLFPQNTQYRR